MQVTHETFFFARCPANPEQRDLYNITLDVKAFVQVEQLRAEIEKFEGAIGWQETITQELANRCNARVTTRGRHGEFTTTCVCEPKDA